MGGLDGRSQVALERDHAPVVGHPAGHCWELGTESKVGMQVSTC